MNKLTSLFRRTLLLVLIATIPSCTWFNSTSECDLTEKTEIEVGIKATVHVLDKNRNPIANQQVKLWLYKRPCGSSSKGQFEFSGPTDAQGIRETTTAFYNLRNGDDQVWVDAHAVNLGNGSAEADSQNAVYKYDDFIAGLTKEVHVYIYRNF
jgi:hypothetical protein